MIELCRVNITKTSGWQASKDLAPLLAGVSAVWLGNSFFPAKFATGSLEPHTIGIPLPFACPPFLHALKVNNYLRLGPVLAVVQATYKSGEYAFDHQSTFMKELMAKANHFGVLSYAVIPGESDVNPLTGYVLTPKGWALVPVPYPDLVYNRFFGHRLKARDRLIRRLLEKGARLVNSPLPDKWICYKWLKQSRLLSPYLPETRLYTSFTDIENMLSRYGEVYVKPRHGQKGKGIVRISHEKKGLILKTSDGSSYRLFSPGHVFHLPFTPNRYIVQQGIRFWNYPEFFDVKVLVQSTGDRFVVTGKVARRAQKDRITTHLDLGGKALTFAEYLDQLPLHLQPTARQGIDRLALDTAEFLSQRLERLGEISLDMGMDEQGRLWIIEVNGKPSRKSFRAAGDIASCRASYDNLLKYALFDFKTAYTG